MVLEKKFYSHLTHMLWFAALMLLIIVPAVHAQSLPSTVIPAATDAANRAIPGLGQPINWQWELLGNFSNTNLGCSLATGTDLGRSVSVYRVGLQFPNTPASTFYTIHVSADGSLVQLCDSKFPDLTQGTSTTPQPPAGTCIGQLVGASANTFPVPAGTTTNSSIATGQNYTVIERSSDNLWYRVLVPNQGTTPFWVAAADLTVSGTLCATLPVFDTNRAGTCTLTPSGAFANVRSTPSVDGAQIDSIFEGTTHLIIGRNNDTTWYRIEQGWVSSTVVQIAGDCINVPSVVETIPVVSATQAPGVVSQYICLDDSTLYLPSRIKLGNATAQVDAGGIPNRIRTAPATTAVVVGEVQPGRRFDRITQGPACNEGYVWWFVEIDGIEGWTAESNGATDEYYLTPTPGNEVTSSPSSTQELAPGRVLTGAEGGIRSVAINPDATFIAATDATANAIYFWDLETDDPIDFDYPYDAPAGFVQFLPDGSLVQSDFTGAVHILSMEDGSEISTIESVVDLKFGTGFSISPDGAMLAAGGCDTPGQQTDCILGKFTIYNIESGQAILTLKGHDNAIYATAFSPDGTILATSSTDGVWLWNLVDSSQIGTLPNDNFVNAIAFSPDGALIAVASCTELLVQNGGASCQLGEVRLWDVESRTPAAIIPHTNEAFSVTFNSTGTLLASGDVKGLVQVWDIRELENIGEAVNTFEGHTDRVWSMDFSPDDTLLVSGSADKTIRVWEVPEVQEQ